MTLTGELDCPDCGARVLRVRRWEDGHPILLETARTTGGWEPMADATGIVTARYSPPADKRHRNGHHAHALQCARTRSSMADSRARIEQACVEPPSIREREAMMSQVRCDDAVFLPVLSPQGVRVLYGASS